MRSRYQDGIEELFWMRRLRMRMRMEKKEAEIQNLRGA